MKKSTRKIKFNKCFNNKTRLNCITLFDMDEIVPTVDATFINAFHDSPLTYSAEQNQSRQADITLSYSALCYSLQTKNSHFN